MVQNSSRDQAFSLRSILFYLLSPSFDLGLVTRYELVVVEQLRKIEVVCQGRALDG
jgi:hypothetical protein